MGRAGPARTVRFSSPPPPEAPPGRVHAHRLNRWMMMSGCGRAAGAESRAGAGKKPQTRCHYIRPKLGLEPSSARRSDSFTNDH
eukprot:scaffold4272_cov370-Prasinococcus_capsulatus_cf.AAC.2